MELKLTRVHTDSRGLYLCSYDTMTTQIQYMRSKKSTLTTDIDKAIIYLSLTLLPSALR